MTKEGTHSDSTNKPMEQLTEKELKDVLFSIGPNYLGKYLMNKFFTQIKTALRKKDIPSYDYVKHDFSRDDQLAIQKLYQEVIHHENIHYVHEVSTMVGITTFYFQVINRAIFTEFVNDFVQSKVRQFATEWATHCSIKLTFVSSGPAEIRVSFLRGKGSWSLIGKASSEYSINPNTGNVYVSSTGTTTNFGWFDSYTPDDEFSRTVIHEFGHAITLIHEHQSPLAGIAWNKPVAYDYYRRTQGWTNAEVDENIFKRYSKSETQYSAYDKLSIMHYAIPAHLLLDPSQAVGWNTTLSVIDKSFIGTIYPFSKNETKKKRKEPKDAHAGDIQGGVH